MLNNSIIESTIRSIENNYKGYKDGGREFINQLSKKLNRINSEEKIMVINFFLTELEKKESDMYYIALETLRNIKSNEVCKQLKKLYTEKAILKDALWKQEINKLIFDLNCE